MSREAVLSGATRYLERVVIGEDRGLLSWGIRLALLPFAALYRIGLAGYLALYSLGLRKRYVLDVPVVSVGNLTFGGTGKTPAVQTICRMLQSQGKKVVVLSRGHGGKGKGSRIVSDGSSILLDSAESGDEPMLLAKSLPGVPVVVGKDRRDSGRVALEKFSPDVIVLDDGLQYWQLHRDLNIVVLDAAKPFGSGFVMPVGDLREPVSGLRRAGIVLLTNSKSISEKQYESLVRRIKRIAPGVVVYRAAHSPVGFASASGDEEYSSDWVRKKRVLPFCGIGKPWSFITLLESLGANVERSVVFPDHHAYTPADLSRIRVERKEAGAELLITTEKDLARLGIDVLSLDHLYALKINLEIERPADFAEDISKHISNWSN